MNYEENFNERIRDGFGMENMECNQEDDAKRFFGDGIQIVEAPNEGFAAMIAEKTSDEWEAEYTMSMQNKRVVSFVKTPFDVQAYADCKCIGDNVAEIAHRAEGRKRLVGNCPLIAEAKENSLDAEIRLKAARGKDFPEESKPEDQFKHLPLSNQQVIDAIDEFLEGCEVTSANKPNMTTKTLFSVERGDVELTMIRDVVRSCVYAYVTQGKRANEIFGTSSIRSFQPAFLDWYYNLQHYTQGEFHVYFSDLYQILLEKTCTDA